MVFDRPIKSHRTLALCLATLLTSACIIPRPPPLAPIVGEFSCEDVEVDIRSTGAAVDVDFEGARWSERTRACRTPCRLSMPSGRYRMISRAAGSGTFDRRLVDIDGGRVRIMITPPHLGTRVPGLIAIPIGGAAVGFGVGAIAVGAPSGGTVCDRSLFTGEVICSPREHNGSSEVIVAGAVTLIAGIALVALGIGMVRESRVRIDIQYAP